MGLGDMFFKLRVKYGSEESKKILDNIMFAMFRSAVLASNNLAREKGTFPKYSEKVFDSQIIKSHFTEEEINELKKHGLRNCSLLSIAPAGSIGTMLNITTGIEPVFQISYQRKTESLHKDKKVSYEVFVGSAKEYSQKYKTEKLPEYFITSSEINWKDRIDIQSIAQRHVDTAISSTINLPKEISIKDIEKLYLYAWEKGLKGVTIYRSGCKREGILTTNNGSMNENNYEYKELPRGFIESVPEELNYRKYKLKTGCGNLYFFVGVDEYDGKIYDCFTNTDGVGGCTINTQANSRLLSAALRGGVPVEYLIQQLNKSGTCPSFQYKKGKGEKLSEGKSCASAIANVLKNILKEFEQNEEEENVELKQNKNIIEDKNKCPECGEDLRFECGCNQCLNCGYSKCE